MTKMDMVWISVASLIHPELSNDITVSEENIHSTVSELFGETITPIMITRHLVNSVNRQADVAKPSRGGSRNRYLFQNEQGRYRLYKSTDHPTDALQKTGPTCPVIDNIPEQFRILIDWYQNDYIGI